MMFERSTKRKARTESLTNAWQDERPQNEHKRTIFSNTAQRGGLRWLRASSEQFARRCFTHWPSFCLRGRISESWTACKKMPTFFEYCAAYSMPCAARAKWSQNQEISTSKREIYLSKQLDLERDAKQQAKTCANS